MCTVVYIRWTLSDGTFDVRLVSAKSRVTPLRRTTVPRSEFGAIVLGVRLTKKVVESLRLKFRKPIFLTDSSCTLSILSKESTVLSEFFGNRQAEVLAYTERSQWFHVPSEENIADLGTKMNARVDDIREGSEWQVGKSWMYYVREKWPITAGVNDSDLPDEVLLAKHMCNAIIQKVIETLFTPERMLARTYTFLMRTTARIFDIYESRTLRGSVVTVKNLEKAKQYLLKESMQRTKIEMDKGNLNPLRPKVN